MTDTVLTLPEVPILKTDNFNLETLLSSPEIFVQVSGNDTIETALAKVDSSHEPVFVKNSDNFQGMLSLTNVLYRSRLPPGAKVKRILFGPPKLTMTSDIFEVAEAMQSTRIYALPVFDKDTVAGVIELATLLKWLVSDTDNVKALAYTVEVKDPVTIPASAGVRAALQLFKTKGVSRLVVVDEQGNLDGILTRNQLRKTYLTPSNRQRFDNTNDPKTHVFDPAEVIKRDDAPIRKLYTPTVFTGLSFWNKEELLTRLIDSEFNSVVIVDQNHKPVRFMSNRDLLQAILRLRPPAP